MRNDIKELTEGMQRLCAVANRIVAADGKSSRLEVDLMMDCLRRLYEVALRMSEGGGEAMVEPEPMPDEDLLSSTVLATMAAMHVADDGLETTAEELVATAEEAASEPQQPAVEEPLPKPEPAVAEPEVEEPAEEPQQVAEPEEEPPAEEPEPEPQPEPVVQSEEQTKAVAEPVDEPIAAAEEAPQSTAPNTDGDDPRQASLLDYLRRPVAEQQHVRTLGEQLAGMTRSSVEVGARKVDDLRTVININDKFSFMNDLFRNNMRAYNEFIMQLNATSSREEALGLVAEVASQYGWDEDTPTVQAFWKIFDKKF